MLFQLRVKFETWILFQLRVEFKTWMLFELRVRFETWMLFQLRVKFETWMLFQLRVEFETWMLFQLRVKFETWMLFQLRVKFETWMLFQTLKLLNLELDNGTRHYSNSRRSHRRCSVEKGTLKNFENFTGKHLCWRLFLIKLQAFRPATLLKRDSNGVLL